MKHIVINEELVSTIQHPCTCCNGVLVDWEGAIYHSAPACYSFVAFRYYMATEFFTKNIELN